MQVSLIVIIEEEPNIQWDSNWYRTKLPVHITNSVPPPPNNNDPQ